MTDACRDLRGDLAMRALGRPDPDRESALAAHLDGCPECRAELADLRSVGDALRLVEPDHLTGEVSAPPGLSTRILDAVEAEVASERQRRRGRTIVTVASAVVVAAAAVVGLLVWRSDGSDGLSVDLAGAEASGSAELVAHAWGTEVTLDVTGLDEGEVYWLWLTGDDDRRIAAGTVTGTGQSLTAVLAAAISFDDARRIWLTDEADTVVLDAMIEHT